MIQIRKAKKEDLNALAQMNHEFQLSEKKVSDKFMKVKSVAALKKRIATQLQKKNIVFFIAEEDGKAIGFSKGLIESYKDDYEGINKIGFSAVTYVREGFRGKKVGTKLLNAKINEFKKRKVDMMTAFVHASNKPALGFVNKKRFKIHSYELRKFL